MLDDPKFRNDLLAQLNADLDKASVKLFDEDFRNHLGASVIGKPCRRLAWLAFRWAFKEVFEGRMLRLFNRGHMEEPRNIRWLTAMGFDVREVDPATGKQYRISAHHGHFGGSADAMMLAPSHYGLTAPILGEFKTHNDNQFKQLVSKGVHTSHPAHVAQVACYGDGLGVDWTLYMGVNKNTDAIHFDWIKTDRHLSTMMLSKGGEVIFSQEPLPKISEHPSFAECKKCAALGICHMKRPPLKNCRTCRHAFPAEQGKWYCETHNGIIPDEVIMTTCGDGYERII